MDLFNVTHGWTGTGPASDKPRSANECEIKAYLVYLAELRGIDHRGAYCGQDGMWRGTGKDAELILPMPGYGQRQVVTVDILDDAGEVVRTSTIGLKDNGSLGIDKAAVRAMVALPPRKPGRKPKAALTAPQEARDEAATPITASEAPAVAGVAPAGSTLPNPLMMLDRIEALEARIAAMTSETVAQAPAQPRANIAPFCQPDARAKRLRIVRRYLAMRQERQEMRERAEMDRTALIAGNAYCQKLQDRADQAEAQAANARSSATAYKGEMEVLNKENQHLRRDLASRPRIKLELVEARARIGQLERIMEIKDKRLALRSIQGGLAA